MSFHPASATSLVPTPKQTAALSAVIDTAFSTPGSVADVIDAHPSINDLWTLLGHPNVRQHVVDAIADRLSR